MQLTGKCKEDFEKWFWKAVPRVDINIFNSEHTPNSMKWGVLVDFFDENDIFIEICKMHLSEYYYWMINDGDEENEHTTRQEARTEAIKKANEIYNSNK